jgi:hypothetical protein
MTINRFSFRRGLALAAVSATLGLPTIAGAQIHHHGFLHRHRTAIAGVGAYALARHAHHGFMHRHPILTGVAAAGLAHHFGKHHH